MNPHYYLEKWLPREAERQKYLQKMLERHQQLPGATPVFVREKLIGYVLDEEGHPEYEGLKAVSAYVYLSRMFDGFDCYLVRDGERYSVRTSEPMIAGGGGALILDKDEGGLRHFLEGKPVHGGDGLEILLPGGKCLRGRYEWGFKESLPAKLHVKLGGSWENRQDDEDFVPCVPEIAADIPPGTVLRWPLHSSHFSVGVIF